MKKNVLVTGANGQLGQELRQLSSGHPEFDFLFTTRETLSLENPEGISAFFGKNKFDICINCAAYTAVDKAESEKERAFRINGEAVGRIASECRKIKIPFIHISTDYVFDGTATSPLREDDPVNPVNAYGASKLSGEELALKNNPATVVIRTPWVYSSFGNNFVKTMLRLMRERKELNVVSDQFGAPTYAADLASALIKIATVLTQPGNSSEHHAGIYHYANEGKISWYDFAESIRVLSGSPCVVHPIPTEQFPTPAKRPAYSVMDTRKIRETFGLEIPFWKDSLKRCLQILLKS
jgi:dTDP-4-dehydrorhamnose reductase